jgi:hypothetical protein
VGLGILLFEALLRINLSKHVWLVVSQAGLAALLVACVWFAALQRRRASSSATFDKTGKTVPRESRTTDSLIQRTSNYFQIPHPIEFLLAVLLFVLLIVLSALNVLRQSVNSDEPQHLHTIWGWVRGFVQYRDLFDNHMPLFHILFAPIFAMIGERPTIVYWMRLALLPMNFVAAWCTYRVGSVLFSRRAGLWAMLSVGLFINYYHDATDFGPNNLWLPLWLLCLLTLLTGTMSVRRALVAGVLLGFCFAVSMKSTVFLLSLILSALLTIILSCGKQLGASWPVLTARAAAFLFGSALIPAVILIFFARMGVWREFRYGVFDFNLLANRFYEDRIVYKSNPFLGFLILAMVLPPIIYTGRWIIRAASTCEGAGLPRLFVLLVCGFYFVVVQIFWPPISRTYRPILPLAVVLATGALLAFPNALAIRPTFGRVFRVLPLPAFVAVVELLFLLGTHPFLKTGRKSESGLLRQVLALTGPDDYVFDCKGETIFRKRSSPFILERITIKAIQHGMLIDDTPRRCIETRTALVGALTLRCFSQSTRQFIERNYLPISDEVRVAGTRLTASMDPGQHSFEIVIPGSYEIVSSDGPVSGTLDGVTYDGARFLDVGRHSFESESKPSELFCVWGRAVERNLLPVAYYNREKR